MICEPEANIKTPGGPQIAKSFDFIEVIKVIE